MRANALLLSVAAQFNNPTAKPVFEWFRREAQSAEAQRGGSLLTSLLMRTDSDVVKRVASIMRAADLGIQSWELDWRPLPDGSWEELSDEAREATRVLFPDPKWPVPKAVHIGSDGKEVLFDLEREESEGTKQFYGFAGMWILASDMTHVLTRDEIETSLHPLLTRFLVEGIHGMPSTSQLLFSTHECSLLDRDLLRRDQIWFTEKKPDGSTELYSLWDFKVKPRQDDDFRGRYLKGRYGAVPYIGEWSFDKEEDPQEA